MEDDLDTVAGAIEQLNAADLVEDGIVAVVLHVVRHDRGQRVTLEGKDALLERNLVGIREQCGRVDDVGAALALVASHLLEQTFSDARLDLLDRVAQLLGDSLPLERLDGVRVGGGRHDDKGDHSGLGAALLQLVVETCQRLDEHVDSLVAVFISTSSKEIERVVEIKVVVAVEVALTNSLILALDT